MEYSTEQLRELYRKVPQEIQGAISSMDNAEKFQQISKKYNLHIDQSGALSKTALLLMLGILKPQDFVNKLSDGLKMPVDKVRPLL